MINKSCFFMVCTKSTEKECLDKNLFGEKEWLFTHLQQVKEGDIGFLLNVSNDELLGIFIAESKAQIDIDPNAWRGGFPAQIRVKLIGELQRIKDASSKLKKFFELIKIDKSNYSYFIPKMKTYGPEITEKILSLFNLPTDFDSKVKERETTVVSSNLPSLLLDEVAGLNEIKKFIHQRIVAPFDDAERAYQLKLKIGGGILLFGPPGTGKTMISQAIAKSIDAKFIEISPSIILGYPGEAEKRLEDTFRILEREPRAVLFLDEAEWILNKARGEGSTIMMRVIPLLLSLLSKIFKDKTKPIIVIAATNKPELIDSAFLRPGRFDKIFYVKLPDESTRAEILKFQIKKRNHSLTLEDISDISKKLNGYSGADIEYIVDEAAFEAFEKKDIIKKDYILKAIQKIRKSVSDDEVQRIEEWARQNNLINN